MKTSMKLSLAVTCFLLLMFSCKKNVSTNEQLTPTSISGKWNIQKDSVYVGVGLGNHEVTYIGKAGDYFNFSNDGHIYAQENFSLDTLSYMLNTDSVIVSNFSGFNKGRGQVKLLSTHSLVISSGYFYTPGGTFGRTVYLER